MDQSLRFYDNSFQNVFSYMSLKNEEREGEDLYVEGYNVTYPYTFQIMSRLTHFLIAEDKENVRLFVPFGFGALKKLKHLDFLDSHLPTLEWPHLFLIESYEKMVDHLQSIIQHKFYRPTIETHFLLPALGMVSIHHIKPEELAVKIENNLNETLQDIKNINDDIFGCYFGMVESEIGTPLFATYKYDSLVYSKVTGSLMEFLFRQPAYFYTFSNYLNNNIIVLQPYEQGPWHIFYRNRSEELAVKTSAIIKNSFRKNGVRFTQFLRSLYNTEDVIPSNFGSEIILNNVDFLISYLENLNDKA